MSSVESGRPAALWQVCCDPNDMRILPVDFGNRSTKLTLWCGGSARLSWLRSKPEAIRMHAAPVTEAGQSRIC